MMRPAIADRIIVSIKRLRKDFNPIFRLPSLASYSLELLFLLVLGTAFASYFWYLGFLASPLVFLSASRQTDLLAFFNKKSGKDSDSSGGSRGLGVAIYLRVSTPHQAEKYSLPDQEQRGTDAAKKLNAVRIYKVTEVESATDFVRPGIVKLLELASKGLIQVVLVTALNRIGRDLIESLYFLRKLRQFGVTVQATTEGPTDITTEEGLIKATTGLLMAHLENIRRRAVSMSGKVQAFTLKHWFLPIPPGYRKKADGWIEKEADNANWTQLIKAIFGKFLETRSYRAVLNYVNSNFKSFRLKRHQVERILNNPIYCGMPSYSDKTVNDPSLTYEDPETFDKAHKISSEIAQHHKRVKEDALSALLKRYGVEALDFIPKIGVLCSRCGRLMVHNGTQHWKEWKIRIYRCSCKAERLVPTRTEITEITQSLSNSPTSGNSSPAKLGSIDTRAVRESEKETQRKLTSF
jgi:DNA invertase Pin-like site-specific DNA recombinase